MKTPRSAWSSCTNGFGLHAAWCTVVKVSPDGTILSRRIVQSSGNRAWDDAVLRAIDKTEVFPKDTDGRVPSVIVLGFRPQN